MHPCKGESLLCINAYNPSVSPGAENRSCMELVRKQRNVIQIPSLPSSLLVGRLMDDRSAYRVVLGLVPGHLFIRLSALGQRETYPPRPDLCSCLREQETLSVT